MGFKRTPEGRVFFQGADQIANKGQGSRPLTDDNAQGASSSAPRTANDAPPRPKDRTQNPQPLTRGPISGDQTQLQIVALLKGLNERLKITQAERDKMMRELESYRALIEDLEDKSSRNERLTLDLEHQLQQSKKTPAQPDAKALEAEKIARETLKELQQTRKHLAEMEEKQREQTNALAEKLTKSGANYAALSRRIKDTETRQTELDEKVDTAVTQQAKLMRKLDKAIEDRARFMRKIERIEETVIQTRDSLNAKAMVLLTEQGATAQTPAQFSTKSLLDDEEANDLDIRNAETLAAIKQGQQKYQPTSPEYEKAHKLQTALAVAAMLIIGVSGGLLWNYWQNTQTSGGASLDQSASQTTGWENIDIQPESTANVEPSLPEQSAPAPITAMDWAIEPQPEESAAAQDEAPNEELASTEQIENALNEAMGEEQAEAEENATAPIQLKKEDTTNDVGAIDLQNEEQVAALLEDNPQALAAQLNAIEPQNLTPNDKKADTAATNPAPAKATEQADIPAPAYAIETLTGKTEQQLRSLTSADSALPNGIKTIEDQAFKGNAEAQHDLAAIYTAGHGGVKQNYKRAGFWFERAAEGGIANASYNLGVLHHQGLGYKPDIDEAMRWYERAAAQGHPEAQYNLGIAYIEGIGVTYDPQKASRYFANAANNGIMEAAYNLGLIYENGLLGNAQPNQALFWYKTAADQGSPEAKEALEALAKTLGISLEDVNSIAQDPANAPSAGPTATKAAPPADKQTSVTPAAMGNDTLSGATSNLSTNDQGVLAQIQEYLMRTGLYPGPADGINGALTEDAIRSYQSMNDLPADGIASQSLLGHMLSNSAESRTSRLN